MSSEAALRERAQQAFAAKNWPAAEQAYTELTGSPAHAVEGYYGLGVAKLAQGKRAEAKTLFERVIERERAHANALYYLGLLSDDPESAERFYAAALAANPGHAAATKALGGLRSPKVAPSPPPAAEHSAATADLPDIPSGTGVYDYLRRDSSPVSKQAVALIDALQMERRLRFTAHFSSLWRNVLYSLALTVFVGVVVTVLPWGNELPWLHNAPSPPLKVEPSPSGGFLPPVHLGGSGPGTPNGPAGTRSSIISLVIAVGLLGTALRAVWLFARVRTTTVRLANGRLYQTSGVFSRRLKTIDLWVVRELTLDRTLLMRLTGDGVLVFQFGSAREQQVAVAGLAKGTELDRIYQQLQDLRFALRANPALKGIVVQ